MIKAVLFDMDGLMFDTEHLSDLAWVHVGEKMQLLITEDFLQSLKGRNRKDCTAIMKSYWGQELDLQAIRNMHQSYICSYIKENGVPIKEGLQDLMEYLKQHNYKIGLATSTNSERAIEILEVCGMIGYFDKMTFGDMVAKGKPEPDIYLSIASMINCSPNECLVLEDSPNGILAGYNAGCHVVMVPDCIAPSKKEKDYTERIVSNLRDVICYLEEIRTME